jgi:uncharacterized membrane protein YagU involved in acid resistance
MSMKKKMATVGVGVVSGLAGLLLMNPVTTKIQDLTPQEIQEKEKEVQPESAMKVAAEKTADALGVTLTDKQAETGGTIFHYAIGIVGGMIYALLRRYLPIHPVWTGLLTGLGIFVVMDEGLNAALGFSAPPSAFPKETHARGLIGHLAFGLGVAGAAEGLRWVGEKSNR